MDLAPWQRRLFMCMWVGSASFALGQIAAERIYNHLTGRKHR